MACASSHAVSRIDFSYDLPSSIGVGVIEKRIGLLPSQIPRPAPIELDKSTSPNGLALESRNRDSQHIETWKVNAVNMSNMFVLVYGLEWLGARLGSSGELRDIRREAPRKYTLGFARDAWGLSIADLWQELRDRTNMARLRARVERPTFEQIELIGLIAVRSTGGMVFQRANAFDLSGPIGYCQSDHS